MNKTTEELNQARIEKLEAAAKLAKEALEKVKKLFRSMTAIEWPDDPYISVGEALAAITSRMAEQDHIADAGNMVSEPVKQEPVGVISESAIGLVKLHSNGACLPFGTQLYTATVSAEAIRAGALEEAAKVCRTAQAKGLQSIREAIEAAIRGLK